MYQPFLSATKLRLITDGDVNAKSKEITTSQEIFHVKTVQTKAKPTHNSLEMSELNGVKL